MAKMISKRSLRSIVVLVLLAGLAYVGYAVWKARQARLPPGIASGNGRIESKLVDVTTREPLRVKEILVNEGDNVKPGQVVVRMDTTTLDAQLTEAKAKMVAAEEQVAVVNAAIVKRKSEIELAQIELARVEKLVKEKAASQREVDVRRTTVQTTTAALAEEEARLKTAQQEVQVARDNAAVIQTRINDATLPSPVRGRVLYRLAEVGETLAAGGKVLTLVNLDDVYMEIFLPASEAARLKIGAPARITLDYAPDRAAVGYVSFVSPEAQFTPKQVETLSERTKLMFRVKIQLPEEVVASYFEYIKTGVRGVGYVKYEESAVWPAWLEQNLLTPRAEQGQVVPARQRLKEVP